MFSFSFIALSLLTLAPRAGASDLSADELSVSSISAAGSRGIRIIAPISQLSGGLFLSGSSGTISVESSATASGLWGDGASLSNVARQASTQSFSGSNQFTSSFTVQSGGRTISLSTSSTTQNLLISQDGTVLFTPEFHNSTSTILSQFSTNVTYLGPCVPGSTLTIRTNGGRIQVVFTGAIQSSSAAPTTVAAAYLLDGALESAFTSSKGFVSDNKSVDQIGTFHFDHLSGPVAAGTHQICLTLASFNFPFTFTLRNTTSSFFNYASNIFYAKELK